MRIYANVIPFAFCNEPCSLQRSSDASPQVAVVAAQIEQCQGHVLVKGLWLAHHRRGNIHMQLNSIYLGLSFDKIIPEVAEEGHGAERYAVALCAEEQAHLSVFMAAPVFRIPSASLLPLAHALVKGSSAWLENSPRLPSLDFHCAMSACMETSVGIH
jgi:hypothetical protein